MRLALALVLLALAAPASGQPQQVLFPDLAGADLRAAVDAAYSPASITGTNDDLYAVVDSTSRDGQLGVVGVYTGLFVPFDGVPNSDPSQDVFNGGSGINQEHTWPKSLLDGRAEDDLHNLFPTRVSVNSDRGSLPFAEIPDSQTTRWYRDDTATATAPPEAERDGYSELRAGVAFEPREAHKGNVARALFYMATVHDAQTNATFSFDAAQRRTLYDWHYADPVDQAELDRTYRVAAFQADTPNPFVLDSTLIRRAYFPEIVVASEAEVPAPLALRAAGPNPFRDAGRLALVLPAPADVRAEAFDALGRRVAVLWDGPAGPGPLPLTLDGAALAPGVYLVRVEAGGATASRVLVRAR